MAEGYRYHNATMGIQYYREPYDNAELSVAGQPDTQPAPSRELFPVSRETAVHFAAGVADIRGYPVNTPDGDTLGTVEGFLADAAHHTIPYLYVATEGKMVVVPVHQVMVYPEQCLLTLEGGIPALQHAPQAEYNSGDAQRAEVYWLEFRRKNAA